MSDDVRGRGSVGSSAATLAVLAALCTALVAATHRLTRERIAENEQAFLEQSLQPVLEGIDYDGRLSDSTITIPPPHELPGDDAATVFRVYADDEPIAALFVVTAPDGYSGPIELLIGIDAGGAVTRVRVLSHGETPGLGDRIEASKSDWIEQFSGSSLDAPPADRWRIRRDDGAFDQLSGASITSRAIVQAVRQTLLYFTANRERVFARDASQPGDAE